MTNPDLEFAESEWKVLEVSLCQPMEHNPFAVHEYEILVLMWLHRNGTPKSLQILQMERSLKRQ
ncbi:UNVERIFIED_CONTAM: hypothetical protein NCL1_19242 [Trichonephila clavipes]